MPGTSVCQECSLKFAKRDFEDKVKVLTALCDGNTPHCQCDCGCNESNIFCLNVDHKNGDGHLMPKGPRSKIYKYLRVHYIDKNLPLPDDLQVLCVSCNNSKYIFEKTKIFEKTGCPKKYTEEINQWIEENVNNKGTS